MAIGEHQEPALLRGERAGTAELRCSAVQINSTPMRCRLFLLAARLRRLVGTRPVLVARRIHAGAAGASLVVLVRRSAALISAASRGAAPGLRLALGLDVD